MQQIINTQLFYTNLQKNMRSTDDQQFQFKQNNKQAPNTKTLSHTNPCKTVTSDTKINSDYYADRKTIICANPKLGLNVDQHLNIVMKFYQEKILKESITKAVVGTFLRRGLINQGQFNVEKAYKDAEIQSKCYVDKIQTLIKDSVTMSQSLVKFQQYKAKKYNERKAKIASIMGLIQKIAIKVQDKKLEEIKANYEKSLQDKVIKIPENKEYNKALYKLKFIKERVQLNKRKLEAELETGHEN